MIVDTLLLDPIKLDPSAASTASKPSEVISKRSSVEVETQPYPEPKHQNDKVITASTGEHSRRSKRIASSTRVDYTVKKRRSVTLQEPDESSSKRTTSSYSRRSALSSHLAESSGTKRAV